MRMRKQIFKILIAVIFICVVSLMQMQTTNAAILLAEESSNTETLEKDNNQPQNNPETTTQTVQPPKQPNTMDDIINAGSSWINAGKQSQGNLDEDYFAEMFVSVGQVLVGIGVVTVLIVTAVMAIKWITAKPDQQAKLKQQLIGLVVSIIVIFGAIGIWNLVRGIMSSVEEDLGVDVQQTSSIINNFDENIRKI